MKNLGSFKDYLTDTLALIALLLGVGAILFSIDFFLNNSR